MNNSNMSDALAALSSRVIALEGAIHALVCGGNYAEDRALAAFDAFGREMLDRYCGLAVSEQTIESLERSLSDLRLILLSGSAPISKHEELQVESDAGATRES